MLENKKRHEDKKRTRETIYIIIVSLLLIAFISLQFFIADRFTSEMIIFVIININLVLLLLLLYLIIRNVFKVFIEYRRGIVSRIKYKLVFAYLILSIAPAFLLFFISSAFISSSIERWFNVQHERALDEALKVAKTFYRNSSENALFYAKRLSDIVKEKKMLDQENLPQLGTFLQEKKKEYNLESVEVFSALKEPLYKEIPQKARPTDPNSFIIQDALNGKNTTIVEESKTGDIIRASVPIFSTFIATDAVGVVVVSYHIPHSIVSKMQIISETYEKYSSLLLFKKPLKSALIIILLVTTLIIIFTSIWFGMHMSKQITNPLDEMTSAAEKVSEGNMDIRVAENTKDEIGHLAKAFNTMLTELKSRKEIIEEQSNYLKILMNKVATGIISVSPEGKIVTMNEAFKKIFSVPEESNKSIADIFGFSPGEKEIIELFNPYNTALKERILPIVIDNNEKYIKVEISSMCDEKQRLMGFVGVFDDITENIRFQKILAWREVARKVAHEIKNPLTPIQLSANRLKKKYEQFIEASERITFNECIDVIVSQVEDIKKLINEFSTFGRMPSLKFLEENINDVLNELYTLFKVAHKNIEIHYINKNDIPRTYCDKEQLKRAFINIMTNAVDALEGIEHGKIDIISEFMPDENSINVSFIDNGKGIKGEHKEKLFEPYFSRKKGGTGLGLYIVNTIITEHGGKIAVRDVIPNGSEFVITLPIRKENR